jgi:hypothetical protein
LKKILLLCFILIFAAACTEKTVETDKPDEPEAEAEIKIDIDLTAFSTTMAYSMMTDVFNNPYSYIGQIIRTNGVYELYFCEVTESYFHYIIVDGPENCCPKILEFKTDGDEPEGGARIQITGEFGIYEDMGFKYIYLAADEVIILE